AVALAGLATFAELQVLAEEPLLEDVLLKLAPLADPRVVRVVEHHPRRGDEAVERHGHAEEDSAHAHQPPAMPVATYAARRSSVCPPASIAPYRSTTSSRCSLVLKTARSVISVRPARDHAAGGLQDQGAA